MNHDPVSTSPAGPDGQDPSFEELVRCHRAAFERLARRLARDAEDAEDLLQETLVDAYRAFRSFRAHSHFYGWVARIMTNNHLDRVRRKTHPVISLDQPSADATGEGLDVPDESHNPERVMLRQALDHPLQSALDALQPVQRATVLLCDLEGATYEEAARAEACPIGTIRSRLHRAHSAIREFLTRLDAPKPEPAASRRHSRRAFLAFGTAAAAGAAFPRLEGEAANAETAALRVLIRTGERKVNAAYSDGMAAAITEALHGIPGVEIHASQSTDPEGGLGEAALSGTDVLILCDDASVVEAESRAIAARVRDGMGLITLHSAVRSSVFRRLVGGESPASDAAPIEGPLQLEVTAPRHPIARGVSSFHVVSTPSGDRLHGAARPDLVVFGTGRQSEVDRTRQGAVWTLGRGRVFYFQPGSPDAPVFLQAEVRQILRNAVCWCGSRGAPES